MTKSIKISAIALGFSVLFSGTSFAQNKQRKSITDSIISLRAVEVTGHYKPISVSRLGVPAKELPITASRIQLEPLKTRGIFEFSEATRFTPGVNTKTSYGAFKQVSIRGFNYAPVELDGMRDERTTFNSYPMPDLSMVNSLEVLKGPSAVQSGHSAVGGVINIVRKSASSDRILDVFLMGGSWNTYQTTLTVGGKVCKGIQSLLNVNFAGGDQWRNRGDKRFSLYNNTKFILGEQHDLDFRIGYSHDFYGTEIGLPPTMPADIYATADDSKVYNQGDLQKGLNRSWRYNNESDFMYNTNFNASLKYNYYLSSDWKLSEYVMYTYDDIDYFGTEELSYMKSDDKKYSHYYKENGKKKYIDLDHVRLTFPLRFEHIAKTLQNHLELNGKFDLGRLHNTFLLGTSYVYMDRVSFSGYNDDLTGEIHGADSEYDVYGPGVMSIVDVKNPKSKGPMGQRFSLARPSETRSLGFYVQDFLEFSPKLKALLALRYDHYNLKSFGRLPAIDREAKYKKEEATSSLNYNALTYRLGMVYQPIKAWTMYASLANYFLPLRSTYSDKNILLNRDGKIIKNPDYKTAVFDPTSGYQIELGSSYDLSERLSVSASVYHINQNNAVRGLGNTEINGERKSIVAQIGQIISKGVDAELHYAPTRNLFFNVGYGYNDIRYGAVKENELGLKDVAEGVRLTNIPATTFYSYGNYTFTKGVLKGLDLNYSVTFTDKVYRNVEKNIYYDAYTLVNGGVRYFIPRSHITIGVQVNNIFNTEYFAQSLSNQLVPSEPCNLKFMLRYRL